MSRPIPPFAQLTVALALVWVLFALPAKLLAGDVAVEGLTYAVVLCLLPGWLVLARFGRLADEYPLVGLVAGMLLRMVVVLACTVLICVERPDLRGLAFLGWLAPCYLVALVVETRWALSRNSRSASPVSAVPPAASVGS